MVQNALLSSFILQLCLATLAFAAPVADKTLTTTAAGNSWSYGTGGGIIGFVVLILDIIVFVEVVKSNRPPVSKLLWCLVVFLFPIIGLVVYWLFSNRVSHNSGSGYETLP
ncbi:cardiolipin synthase [Phialemonium atrogriseum]|uniref:Cardiolipin synthase n=1 Tax=Phialemonium atrogriseum TaxID=1093897 RepID=A0AAJ0FJR4_9PEZI|nr:cardiolipin synthase [Phialemonium atrogriseum]KAK1763365.1 cardiolipin synthase [Phialemonium atrogriseum]